MEEPQVPTSPAMRRLEQCCDASAAVGALVLIAVALMTTVSVVGRAFFSHPILGDVELVQLGCAVVVTSFLPYTQFRRANIIVDFGSIRKLNYVPESPVMRRRRCRWPRRMPIRGK